MTGLEVSIGVPDKQTVTPAGVPTTPIIHGVETRRPVTHVDHRGALFEIYSGNPELWPEPVVYVYQTSLFPGQIKGWNRHEAKTDRYTIAFGELIVLLYDPRQDSPTFGVSQNVALSPRGDRQLRIPVGVWHLLANVGNVEAQLVNLPTEVYDHEKPDRIRLPWDSPEIPVNVRDFLPQF
jgi:dTDP-4-dehydrorhamnose 3,5-epimerase